MLQEVVPSTLALLQEALGETYHVIAENSNFSYFTAVLINKNIVVESQSFRCFDNSKQGRGLQIVECSYNGIPLKIVNCHLESLGDNSAQRKAQFKELMETVKTLKDKNPESVVIGGGDLNIREKEVSRIPNGIKDAWIAAGSDAEKRWTWDTQKNDNKSLRSRLFRRSAGPSRVQPSRPGATFRWYVPQRPLGPALSLLSPLETKRAKAVSQLIH
ncbi:hypothetical protein L596_016562 [Steinernema carpocapsae]|uniref:Inositol polyphosphate-related phosphatase domain-containing protein n=1 Tax=Steinernema carpocapsae TaxID=34508 RepID=A0A4U5NJA6_STECR|nr:hypothetical protein L596_016562 [Steinernema carpocapsae]